jgi:cobalt-zinc-cadmium efflux system outer membrane protein
MFLTGSLFAQLPTDPNHRNRYLQAAPLPPVAPSPATLQPVVVASATEPLPAAKPATGVAALPKQAITLAEINTRVTNDHPGVQQAKRQAEALRGEWIQAGLKPNPSVGYSAEEMTSTQAGKHGVTLTQPVTPKYKRDARQLAIDRAYQAALQTYQIQHQKAVNDATLAAYRADFAYRKCLILEELTQIAQEALKAAGELLKAQEIELALFLGIKIQAERTQIDRRDAEIAYRTACNELAILLNLPDRGLLEITDRIDSLPPELNPGIMFAEIRASSPELRQGYAEIEAAKARLKQECAEGGIDYDTNVALVYNTETKQSEVSVGIAIPIRLFDRNQGNIQRAKSELAAANRNVERLERLLAQRCERQWGEYQTARNRVVSYADILKDAREALDLAFDAYRRGEYGSHELLEAQRTFSSVQIEYNGSLQALMESHILLQGSLLSGGLEKPGTE